MLTTVMSRRARVWVVAVALAMTLALASSASAAVCPTAPDPNALPDAGALKQMNSFVASLGVRPTGSATHAAYVNWIRQQLQAIPGVQISDINYTINRWSTSSASLTMHVDGHDVSLPIADAIPYSQPTGADGVTAPLVVVPDSQRISGANSAGKIVVREADAGSVPYADFLLPVVSWETYDPNHTIDPTGNFYGDFINYNPRVNDLRDAAAAGAKGLLYVKNVPRAQIIDHYEPYEGEDFRVPGVFLGADEGKQITDAIAAGKNPSAQIIDRARFDTVQTPSIEAVIPGETPQRIVVDSHTDGTNAVEDNGPVAMVAMARYYAALPVACRPRTIQFAFSTAHFYQRLGSDPAIRDGGAEQLAEQLDRDYDKGTVSSVVVLEHLGALDYEQVPRTDGGPGVVLKPNGLRAIQFIGVTPSPSLVAAVDQVVRTYDMQRTILLQGADAPGNTVPMHCSFGGEGTPYNAHLLPTVGVISAPQFLYDPAFELDAIDFNVMHSELLGFTELVNRLQVMPQAQVSGSVDAERMQRAAGAPPCPQQISAPPYGPAPPNGEPLETLSTLPPARPLTPACTSRRRFVVHVRAPKGFHARSARLQIGGRSRAIRVRRQSRFLSVAVDLRGQPPGVTEVRLTIRGAGKRSIRTRRTYRLCRPGPAGHRSGTKSRRV
jgi:hypothetical protein